MYNDDGSNTMGSIPSVSSHPPELVLSHLQLTRSPPDPKDRPSQITFIRDAQMSLFANLVSWPPLGQVTFMKRRKDKNNENTKDKVRFTVVLESSCSFPEQPWSVAIWHNINGQPEWEELTLGKSSSTFVPMEINERTARKYRRYLFNAEIDFPPSGRHAAFTIKYRTDSSAQWQWTNEQFGTKDGELVFEPLESPPNSLDNRQPPLQLETFIDSLNSEMTVECRQSESPGAALWSIACDVCPRANNGSVLKKLILGTPNDFVRNFSLVRIWSPWLAPRHGSTSFRLTEDAILLSFLRRDGLNLVLLAVSGLDNVLTLFQSGGNGEVIIAAQNDNDHEAKAHVFAAVSSSFESANAAVMYAARKTVRQFSDLSKTNDVEFTKPTEEMMPNDLKPQWFSKWYDSLGYCTWNALGPDLTEQKILDALDTLDKDGINIGNLILDDNWQSLDNDGEPKFKRGMTRFDANTKGFPQGLKHTVDKIRQRFPKIRHVAVWHALMGYWGGISPNGEIARDYKTAVVKRVDKIAGGTMMAVDPDDVLRFYDKFYDFLSSAGINSVKTDAQFFLDILESPSDRVRFITAYQDAWSISSLRYFQAKAISCMSQVPQLIFHSQLPTTKPCIVLRTSDDFFPDVLSSHPWHIFCNAHNSVLTQHLNVIPDWDMFQTDHPYASFHAAARCVSGGVIYITDEPGKHDFNIVNQMTAPTTHGNTVILRPSVIGRPMEIYHNYNEGHILKVGTYNGWAKTGNGILGLFNIASAEASSLISILEFPGISLGEDLKYIIRAHTTGFMTHVMRPSEANSLVYISLKQRGWEILTIYPIQSMHMPTDGLVEVAILGLLEKMTGVAAIVNSDITMLKTGTLRFNVTLKALGTLGIYISKLESKSILRDFMVILAGKPVPVETVTKRIRTHPTRDVLSIDVLTAWKEMDFISGWSNEVTIQIFMS